MIGVRMIEPEQVSVGCRRSALDFHVVGIAHTEAASRAFLCGIGQRHGRAHAAVPAEHRAATFVRISVAAVRVDGVDDVPFEAQRIHVNSPR